MLTINIIPQPLKSAGIDLLMLPRRFGEEEPQPLHRRVLGPGHRFRPGQGGQRLVPLPRGRQPGQVPAQTPPLGQRVEEAIEAGGVILERPRRRWTRTTSGHGDHPCPSFTATTVRRQQATGRSSYTAGKLTRCVQAEAAMPPPSFTRT
ncbi:hypothetical protein GCM10010129_44190 [Streptomyces fumigatiscleroticus]|nr:hypothetical protein GCM10010129_44190 [Streptomyces fumigatiscleroticus]